VSLFIQVLPRVERHTTLGVILVNGVTSSFVVIGLGFMVGKVGHSCSLALAEKTTAAQLKTRQARGACREKALKDGDADAEARFSYPKLYAEGFSEEAKNFNCVQRGHQQALETYTQFVALSLIGGIRHPVLVTAAGLLWCYARVKWAQGYATGDPGKRYTNSKLAWHIWTTLIFVAAAAASTGIQLLLA